MSATGGPSALVNDPALMADPFPTYAQWRHAGPVHQSTTPDGQSVWLVTRYDDVRSALSDPRLSLSKTNARPGGYKGFSLPPALDANLLNLDPPDHTRLRRLVSQAFTRRRVEALRPAIQQHADSLIDQVLAAGANESATGDTDLIGNYAVPLPLAVIGDLFAVPPEHLHDFRDWTSVLLAPEPGQAGQARQAVGNMVRFLVQLITVRRTHPGDDLLSAMISARDDHDRLNDNELTSLAFLILWAGYENSVHLIGNSILALLQRPEAAAQLLDQPALTDQSINELLRFADPNQYAIRRFPTENLTIGGTLIPAGDTVLLVLASANRDPAHYANPDALDLTRTSNPHLSFGAGIHHCLGAPLARLETDIAIGTLFCRIPTLALAVPARDLTWRPSFRSRGLHRLPATFTA